MMIRPLLRDAIVGHAEATVLGEMTCPMHVAKSFVQHHFCSMLQAVYYTGMLIYSLYKISSKLGRWAGTTAEAIV